MCYNDPRRPAAIAQFQAGILNIAGIRSRGGSAAFRLTLPCRISTEAMADKAGRSVLKDLDRPFRDQY